MSADPRAERCPDGGYCHGTTVAAGSPPCEEGACFRVRHAGPLSGVYPGDRWPDEVRLREVRAERDRLVTFLQGRRRDALRALLASTESGADYWRWQGHAELSRQALAILGAEVPSVQSEGVVT